VEGRNIGAIVAAVDAAIKNFPFTLEYHAEVVTDYTAEQAAEQRLLVAGIVTILGILLLVQASVRSWRLALVAILTIPAALAGGILANLLGNGGTLSFGLLAGCLTVLGIALRNSILLFSHYQHLEEKEGQAFGPDLMVRGARERLSPILMTALTTGLALLPFVLLGNIPGHEIVRPISIVIIGGLITSTWLNLFAMPALYMRFGASREADLGFQRVSAVAADD
jgi:Cu/Ag efflux pump CusA